MSQTRPHAPCSCKFTPEPASAMPNETRKGKLPATGTASSSTSAARDGVTKERARHAPPPTRDDAPSSALDALQLAAQMQSWLYMTSTLGQQLEASKQTAHLALEKRAKELAAEEADIADARARFDAERLLAIYEEDAALSSTVCTMVQSFLRQEHAYSLVTSEAMLLASQTLDGRMHVRSFNELLGRIDTLQQEYCELKSCILAVSSPSAHSSGVVPVVQSLLRVQSAHSANLDSLRSLVQCSKDNLRTFLQMESMRLADV